MSFMTKLYNMYTKSPVIIKNSAALFYNVIPAKYRYGKVFNHQYTYLKQSEYLSKDEIECLQNKKFLKLINHAYENVPYYRDKFDEYGVNIKNIKDLRDIKLIPLLTKDDVKENINRMVSKNVNINRLKYITTGGTSGKPFGLYIDYDNELVEWAYVVNCWSRIGYKPYSSRLVLRGKVFDNLNKGIPWQYDNLRKELSISIFDMTDENMSIYIRVINKYKPEFMHGYMSAIYILCKFIKNNNIKLAYNIKGVFATSENVYQHQIEFVENTLNCRVLSFYGHSERLIFAGECEHSREYHITPQYGYAEIIDDKGCIVKDSSLGELVGTGFSNLGMPLIRYRTGDIAKWSKNKSCKCGRNYPLIEKVEGRWKQEMLVKLDNSLISMTALNVHSNIFDNVKQFQLYQEQRGKVVIKIVPDKKYNSNDGESIITQFSKKTGQGIEYKIEIVDEIPRRTNGKFLFIEQKLK